MIDNFAEALGKWLTEHRTEAGLTEAQIAERMGCTRQRINNWERGIRDMNAKDLFAYCEIVHADPAELAAFVRRLENAGL